MNNNFNPNGPTTYAGLRKIKHSPAPWTINHGAWEITVTCEDGDLSEQHFPEWEDNDETKEEFARIISNALLIAAAPDLLEALEDMINAIECDDLVARDESIGSDGGDHVYHVRRRAEAAIAKARGES